MPASAGAGPQAEAKALPRPNSRPPGRRPSPKPKARPKSAAPPPLAGDSGSEGGDDFTIVDDEVLLCLLPCHICGSDCCFEKGHAGLCCCEHHKHQPTSNEAPDGLLKNLAVDALTTKKTYTRSLNLLNTWLLDHGYHDLETYKDNWDTLDTLLELYVQSLYNQKGSVGLAAATLSAVQDRWPRAKRNLPTAWRS